MSVTDLQPPSRRDFRRYDVAQQFRQVGQVDVGLQIRDQDTVWPIIWIRADEARFLALHGQMAPQTLLAYAMN